jgi:aspartyl protease family protein
MRDEGVLPGTLLFRGTRSGYTYSGTTYLFSRRCGAIPYQVTGTVSADDQHVVLRGNAPSEFNASCQATAYRTDILQFDLTDAGIPAAPATATTDNSRTVLATGSTQVALQKAGGTFLVPVLINNTIILKFTLDSGASDVTIPADVVKTLWRAGTITDEDFIGSQNYTLADGSTMPSEIFRIRSLKVGDEVLNNITGSVVPESGSLLLGESFLTHFKSWSIDNDRQMLVLIPN